MPVQPRTSDAFTRNNLLLGFSQVEFTPALAGGGFGTPVPLGILASEELTKEIETLELERGDSGLITIDRSLVSRLAIALQVETFNFRSDLAQYILASSSITAVTANAAQAVTNEQVVLPASDPFDTFLNLANSNITESSIEVTFATITDEAVGTGDGVANDFVLDQKVKAVGDVTSVTVGGVTYTPVASGAAAAGNEVEVVVGEVDGAHPTTSGSLEFFVGGVATPPTNGAAILATYTPSFNTTAGDIVNLTDFVFDPILGKIRFLDPAGADNSPFRTTGGPATLEVDYTYNRRASNTLKPFTQNTFEGKATINHLPDVGINFIWTIPSASIQITDDSITFDAEDFATGTLTLNILDAGGTDRFGTLNISSEPEQLA